MARVLIPDYPGQHVISGIRALGKEGDICDIAWKFAGFAYVFKSRYIRRMHTIAPASLDDVQYVSDMIALYQEGDYDFALPFGNDSYYAVVKHAKALSGRVRIMAPSSESFSIAHDKSKTMAFCREIGIDVPRTFTSFAENDLHAIANELSYPVVIKARSGAGSAGLRYANSREELFKKYDETASLEADTEASDYRFPIIQEFIPGFIHDACTLTNQGQVVNVLTQVRWIMHSIYGGAGAVNVTTHNSKVDSLARKLLEALKWHGPAQIEFKYDSRDRKYKLIEINPKLWGTLDLSIRVGMNFPGMIRNIMMGEPVHNQTYPANVRYIFMFSQATFSALQLLKEFGIKGLRDSRRYVRTYHDIDIADILPDFLRGWHTLRGVIRGKGYNSDNSNLDKALINKYWQVSEIPGLTEPE